MGEHLQELKTACSKSCKKDGECIKLLQLYVDGEACREKFKYFLDGTCDCKPCNSYFHLHDTIKQELKRRCCDKVLPEDLDGKIRTSILAS